MILEYFKVFGTLQLFLEFYKGTQMMMVITKVNIMTQRQNELVVKTKCAKFEKNLCTYF